MVKIAHSATVLVTGSTSGIGKAIAKGFLQAGFFVYLNGRDKDKGLACKQALMSISNKVGLLGGDVNDPSTLKIWSQELSEQGVNLQVLVANVGSGKFPNHEVCDLRDYKRAMDVNFYSCVDVVQHCLPLMDDGSNILAISSIAGRQAIGAPVPYACAKAALNMYIQELAVRLAKRRIRVNSLSPGNVIFSGSTWEQKMATQPEATAAYIKQHVPLNEFIDPDEIARLALAIVSTRGVTGQDFVIDAGQTVGAIHG